MTVNAPDGSEGNSKGASPGVGAGAGGNKVRFWVLRGLLFSAVWRGVCRGMGYGLTDDGC